MFGFQKAFKASIRIGSQLSMPKMSTYVSKTHLSWTFKYLLQHSAMPVPGAGLTLMNLREILEKCKSQCELDVSGSSSIIDILASMSMNLIKNKFVLHSNHPDIVGKRMTSQIIRTKEST